MANPNPPPVILFGYDSSPFTNKVRLTLRIKGVPFSYMPVPSMMPRPILRQTFGLTYRKIPVLAIGRDIYCDTSLIIEALEYNFPVEEGYGSVYPRYGKEGGFDWNYRGFVRGFASFWVDRPLFRTTTGLIPSSVWRTSFGTDRAQLIGHPLSPEKLASKIPQNLSSLDTHLSLLEPMFAGRNSGGKGMNTWLLPTPTPSLADISLYYQLRWGIDIANGRGIYNLTAGGTGDEGQGGKGKVDITASVFNAQRYPGIWTWFQAFESYVEGLSDLETAITTDSAAKSHPWKDNLKSYPLPPEHAMLVPTPAGPNEQLDSQRGLERGTRVSVAPDDTGRADPTVGVLVGSGVEEVVVLPEEKGELECRVHFPRVGFVVKTVDRGNL
ncbi:hypothetical protein BCR34DRAFT_494055 [Clohesyomyces aquaticus]|uniref:GST N-terminal domain-containing protein n=1 Tax=Clohesyomyces aquaticus TaxID=1231657 RepID=A0A1Y1YTY0_9PLEO|nr:hypothetical protein BCR34DRAFT_494055 [Clohesyomyces aquaticus]